MQSSCVLRALIASTSWLILISIFIFLLSLAKNLQIILSCFYKAPSWAYLLGCWTLRTVSEFVHPLYVSPGQFDCWWNLSYFVWKMLCMVLKKWVNAFQNSTFHWLSILPGHHRSCFPAQPLAGRAHWVQWMVIEEIEEFLKLLGWWWLQNSLIKHNLNF